MVMTSPDGITWTARSAAVANNWVSVTYGNGLFVAVASSGNRVMTSPDGVNWTTRTRPEANRWNVSPTATACSSRWRARHAQVMTSPDGVTWTAQTAARQRMDSVTYGNGLFVAVANTGTHRS